MFRYKLTRRMSLSLPSKRINRRSYIPQGLVPGCNIVHSHWRIRFVASLSSLSNKFMFPDLRVNSTLHGHFILPAPLITMRYPAVLYSRQLFPDKSIEISIAIQRSSQFFENQLAKVNKELKSPKTCFGNMKLFINLYR